jgi:hypothetical protein
MRARGPLLTMAAVGALAAIVFVVSLLRTPAPVEAANTADTSPPAATASTPAAITSTSPAPRQDSVYIGHSSDNEVTVAVAVSGEEAAAYICDGERIEAWLDGTVAGEQVDLQGRNGAELTATLSDIAALGVVTVESRQMPFSAAIAAPPAGIYEGQATVGGAPNRIGWIVLQNGRQVGINNVGGNRQPAPSLDTSDFDGVMIGGADVEVKRIEGRDPVVPR